VGLRARSWLKPNWFLASSQDLGDVRFGRPKGKKGRRAERCPAQGVNRL
jgi:hypothetical protein